MSTQRQFKQMMPTITLVSIPLFESPYKLVEVSIDAYVINTSQMIIIAADRVDGVATGRTKILMYHRLTQVWSCCVDNIPPVKATFFDRPRGKLYLFVLDANITRNVLMCYDVVKKDFNDSYARGDGIVPDYQLYNGHTDVQMVCKDDEVHILFIQYHIVIQYIVWNFVTKERVFLMRGVIAIVSNGCRLFFSTCMDKPRLFAYSNIYEFEQGFWKQLKFNEKKGNSGNSFSVVEMHLNANTTVATECGRYVVSFINQDVVIFDVVSKEIKTATMGVDWHTTIAQKAVYFRDDGKLLTAAFIHQYRLLPSCLVDYIAKWVAQEYIYFCGQ